MNTMIETPQTSEVIPQVEAEPMTGKQLRAARRAAKLAVIANLRQAEPAQVPDSTEDKASVDKSDVPSKIGPDSPDELQRIMASPDSTLADFTRDAFIAGIQEIVKSEHFAAVNQKVLGAFVARYVLSTAEIQATILKSILGPRPPQKYWDNGTDLQRLAEALFYDYPELFVKSTSGATLAEKRISNWRGAYKVVADAAKIAESNEFQAKLKENGLVTLDEAKKNAELLGIPVNIPVAAVKAAPTPRKKNRAEIDVIKALYIQAGFLVNQQFRDNVRSWLQVSAANIGIDQDKLNAMPAEIMQGLASQPKPDAT